MKKFAYTALAALSLVTTPTMAAAAPVPSAPVSTPLTQPAGEAVGGDNQFVGGLSGLGLVFGVGVFAGLVAVIVFAIKSGDNPGFQAPIRTSP